jgi:MoaA/NifB/PqqE/SkfB family radical SAM enzyme
MLHRKAARAINWQYGQQPGPWKMLVFPTYRCNLKCGICARTWQYNPPVLLEELPDERWLRLVDEAAEMGVQYWNIGGGGEPTLRRDLVMNMCAKAKGYGMEGSLQTNGTNLSPENLDALVEMGWDHLTVSLDGPTPEINDAIRCRDTFARAVDCLRRLSEAKKRRRAALPAVQINMVVTALNFDRFEEMVELCVDTGVELLLVSPLHEYSPEMTAFILSEEQRAALPGHIARGIKRANAHGLPNNLESLLPQAAACRGEDLPSGSKSHEWPAGHLAGVHCLEPWLGLSIVSSGQVSPCCFFWEEQADSIRDKSLDQVWHGAYLTEIRQRMRAGRLPKACVHCYFPQGQEHREVMDRVQELARADIGRQVLQVGMGRKAWNSLRTHGVLGSLRRGVEWLAIRHAFRKER